jgi:hypothetical protein
MLFSFVVSTNKIWNLQNNSNSKSLKWNLKHNAQTSRKLLLSYILAIEAVIWIPCVAVSKVKRLYKEYSYMLSVYLFPGNLTQIRTESIIHIKLLSVEWMQFPKASNENSKLLACTKTLRNLTLARTVKYSL